MTKEGTKCDELQSITAGGSLLESLTEMVTHVQDLPCDLIDDE